MPPPTDTSKGQARLDEASLQKLRELDASGALLQRVFNAFIKSLDKMLPELQQARASGLDLVAIRHIAHTLKSSSASLGALNLSAQCADVENRARNAQTEGLDIALDAMHAEALRVHETLRNLVTESK